MKNSLVESNSSFSMNELRELALASAQAVEEHGAATVMHAIKCGEYLIEIKSRLKHGEWLPWLAENWPLAQSQAKSYMRIAKANRHRGGDLEQPTSIKHYLRLIAEQEAEESEAVPDSVQSEADDGESHWSCNLDSEGEEGEPSYSQPATSQPGDSPRPHVSHNSGENEWYTPSQFIESARRVMGGIDLDPATSELANKTVQASMFYTKDDDGLSREWAGRVWMNPPYAQPLISEFCEKLCEHYDNGDIDQACVLVNNATETKWFQGMALRASAICFPMGRVRFLDPDGNPGAPLQGQAIIYLGPNKYSFFDEHKQYGFCF